MTLRHERRRRMRNDDSFDESSGEDAAQDDAPRPSRAGRSRATSDLESAPLLDLVPTRRLALIAITGLMLALIAALAFLHETRSWLADRLGPASVAVLDLDAQGNLAQWSGAMLLGLATLTAILIFSLRQHRADDYHGRYRVWIWIALGTLILSVNAATSVSLLARSCLQQLARACSLGDAFGWPTIPALIGGALGVRLLLEVRRSKWTVAALLTSATLAGTALACQSLASAEFSHLAIAVHGSLLAGYASLLVAFLLYARRVVFELQGRIAIVAPKKKPKKKKAPKASSDEAALDLSEKKEAAPRTAPAAESARSLRIDSSSKAAPAVSARPSGGLADHMASRAERRKLRREAKRAA